MAQQKNTPNSPAKSTPKSNAKNTPKSTSKAPPPAAEQEVVANAARQEAPPPAMEVDDAAFDEKKQLKKARAEAKKKEQEALQEFISSNTPEAAAAQRGTVNNTTMLLEQLETLCNEVDQLWPQMHEKLYTIGDTLKKLSDSEMSTEDLAKGLSGNAAKAGGKIKTMDVKRAKMYQTAGSVAPKFKNVVAQEDWTTTVAINLPAVLKDVHKVAVAAPAFLASFKDLDAHLTGAEKKKQQTATGKKRKMRLDGDGEEEDKVTEMRDAKCANTAK